MVTCSHLWVTSVGDICQFGCKSTMTALLGNSGKYTRALTEAGHWTPVVLAPGSHVFFHRYEPRSVRFIVGWLAGLAAFGSLLHLDAAFPCVNVPSGHSTEVLCT